MRNAPGGYADVDPAPRPSQRRSGFGSSPAARHRSSWAALTVRPCAASSVISVTSAWLGRPRGTRTRLEPREVLRADGVVGWRLLGIGDRFGLVWGPGGSHPQ